MELRRFNHDGLAAFQSFLDSCNTQTPAPWPESALSDPAFSEAIEPAIELQHREFATRFDLAQYLYETFEGAGFRAPRTDAGLWAWLGCFYFHEICPKSRSGELQPGASPRWIPRNNDYRRYYRHLIAGPYAIYRAHRDDPSRALALLCQRPGRPGDLVEQLASRQQIVTNPTIMQVATNWFVDSTTGKQRKSANRKGRGGPRRFITVLSQFDVTWDLSLITPEDLHAHLPSEFKDSTPQPGSTVGG